MASSVARGIQRLYVGNLPFTVGHAELRQYFEKFGSITSAKVVFDKKTGVSKKYGFVTVKASENIVEKLNAKPVHVLEGRTINIQEN